MTEIIHIISGEADPGLPNDISEIVYQLATQQSLAGRRVSVWEINSDLKKASEDHPFTVCFFKKHKKKFGIDNKLADSLVESQGKVFFHIHGGFVPAFFVISKVLHDNDIPFVFAPHGAYNPAAMQRHGFMKSLYIKLYERKLLERSTYIHCPSQAEVDGLMMVFPNAKAVLFPYGFAAEYGPPAAPDKNKFILGFSGHLEIYSKGLDLLVNAFAFVKQVHPGAELWIIGDSKERKQLNRQILSRGLQNDVTMWGSKNRDEKFRLLSKMNMFVSASRNEDRPTSVIEAASMGLPCVVTEASNVGIPIRNFDCGEVIENPDETDLFNAIMNLHHRIKLDGFAAFSEKARHMVAKEYDWDTIVLKFDRLYQTA